MEVITALIGIMFILTAPSVVLIIMMQPVEQSFGTHMEDVIHHVLLSIGCSSAEESLSLLYLNQSGSVMKQHDFINILLEYYSFFHYYFRFFSCLLYCMRLVEIKEKRTEVIH